MSDKDYRDKMMKLGAKTLDMLTKYLNGGEVDLQKLDVCLKLLPYLTKIVSLNQQRELMTRAHAVKVLTSLQDDAILKAYIKLTQPTVAPLLESGQKGGS